MPALTAPEVILSAGPPDRIIMIIPDLDRQTAWQLSVEAVQQARQTMPRVTGVTASRLQTLSGDNFFGIYFPDAQTWFMEHGTKAFTMRSLAGKTIPMWVEDFDGSIRRQNPKAQVRDTEDGRTQVLIFRRAAKIGQRKLVKRRNRVTKLMEVTSVPASYPGAPGRIAIQKPSMWNNFFRKAAGQIAKGNVGVRWRHPGIQAMGFLNSAIAMTAFESGFKIGPVYVADGATWESLLAFRVRNGG